MLINEIESWTIIDDIIEVFYHDIEHKNINSLNNFINRLRDYELSNVQITKELEKNKDAIIKFLNNIEELNMLYPNKRLNYLFGSLFRLLDYNLFWPEFEQILNNKKSFIMKNILGFVKNSDFSSATYIMNRLEKFNINWPELDVIRRSLQAENQGMGRLF